MNTIIFRWGDGAHSTLDKTVIFMDIDRIGREIVGALTVQNSRDLEAAKGLREPQIFHFSSP